VPQAGGSYPNRINFVGTSLRRTYGTAAPVPCDLQRRHGHALAFGEFKIRIPEKFKMEGPKG